MMRRPVTVAAGALVALSLTGCSAFAQGFNAGFQHAQSSSRDVRITIPDLEGKIGQEAVEALSGLDIVFTDSTGEVDRYDAADRTVASTSPGTGQKAKRSSTVMVRLEDVVTDDGSSVTSPAPAGTTITSTQSDGTAFELTLGGVTWDAGAAVAAENQFNDAAPAGQQYALVGMTFKNTGSTEVRPGSEVYDITYLDPSGNSHALGTSFAVIPNGLSGSSVPPGGSVTGNFEFFVPTGTTSGGVFAIKGNPYFFISAS